MKMKCQTLSGIIRLMILTLKIVCTESKQGKNSES